jgi:hypothetical protein
MEKVIAIFVFVLLAGGVMQSANANEGNGLTLIPLQQEEKAKITQDDLPEAVKKTLEKPEYKDWVIDAVVHNITKDIYEVSVKKGGESKTLKFNKDGSLAK